MPQLSFKPIGRGSTASPVLSFGHALCVLFPPARDIGNGVVTFHNNHTLHVSIDTKRVCKFYESVLTGFNENLLTGFNENLLTGFNENVLTGFNENVLCIST
jgi:hypothetical protein